MSPGSWHGIEVSEATTYAMLGFVASRLDQMMQEHLGASFPDSVEKGADYGAIDPVLVDADIYGWALRVSRGSDLGVIERHRFRSVRDDLARSLPLLPEEAHDYYRRLIALADEALAEDQDQER